MKKLSRLALTSISILPLHGYANNLAVDIGKDTFSAEFAKSNSSEDATFTIGAISAEDDHKVYHFKALVTGELDGNENIKASLGGKIYYVDLTRPIDNLTALSLGGEIEYSLPQNDKVKFGLSLFAAPKVTISNDFDLLTDFTITASYQVLNNGAVYLNYRNLKVSHENGGNVHVNDSVNIGLNLTF